MLSGIMLGIGGVPVRCQVWWGGTCLVPSLVGGLAGGTCPVPSPGSGGGTLNYGVPPQKKILNFFFGPNFFWTLEANPEVNPGANPGQTWN